VFAGEVAKVELLGAGGDLAHTRDADGLTVMLPGRAATDFAFSLRVTPANAGLLRGE